MSEQLTDDYLLQLYVDVEGPGLTDEACADIVVQDVPRLIKEIWRLQVELAKADGFNKGLLEGVQWVKRDNEMMAKLLAESPTTT